MKGLDITSPTWRAIEQAAQERITSLREKNDNPSIDEIRTADLRGRISAWKAVLALAKAPEEPADDGGYGY